MSGVGSVTGSIPQMYQDAEDQASVIGASADSQNIMKAAEVKAKIETAGLSSASQVIKG